MTPAQQQTSQNHILLLQAILQALQVINVGIATMQHVPPGIPLMIAATVAGLSSYVQHVGNQSVPPGK